MSTSSGVSDSEDSGHDQYDPIRKLAMVQLQPPRNPNKPFTSFNIRDILGNGSSVRRPIQVIHHNRGLCNTGVRIVRPWDTGPSPIPSRDSDSTSDSDEEINVDDDEPLPSLKTVSPLDALMAMTNKTFEGLETSEAAGEFP